MKPIHAFLAVSLAANVACVVYVVRGPSNAGIDSKSPVPSQPTSAPRTPVPAAALDSVQKTALEKIWSEHAYENPAAMVARLRAAGISSEQARDFLAARREQQPGSSIADRPLPPRPDLAALRAKVQAAQARVSEFERTQYGDLPHGKIREIQRIEADYGELGREIRAKAPGTLIPEDREKLAYLDKEKLADLANLLTPEELDDYLVRRTAPLLGLTYLRDQGVGFRATDDEYHAILRATMAANAQFGSTTLTPVDIANRLQRDQAILDQLAKTLPPERLADYQRASNPTHRAIDALATRLELPATTSDQVIAVQAEIEPRLAQARMNYIRNPQAGAIELASLRDETTAKLTAILTPRGLEAYQSSTGSLWLKRFDQLPFARQPAPPKS